MLSYAEAESALAAIYRASGKAQAGAFRGRLKHFKRLGIPLGVNPGRGKKIDYGQNEVYQWCFCLEFAEFGIDPSVIVKIVRRYWKTEIFPALIEIRRKPETVHYFWISPEFMSASWSPRREFRGISSFGWGELKDMPLSGLDAEPLGLSAVTKPAARISAFNISNPIRKLDAAFAESERQK
jgi:hypothetical protein